MSHEYSSNLATLIRLCRRSRTIWAVTSLLARTGVSESDESTFGASAARRRAGDRRRFLSAVARRLLQTVPPRASPMTEAHYWLLHFQQRATAAGWIRARVTNRCWHRSC